MIKLTDILNEAAGKKEYIIWGVPPGERDEVIAYTKAQSPSEAKKVMDILKNKHGLTKLRLQVLDLSQEFDLNKTFGKTVAIMVVDFTYKNKDNILLNDVSFAKCTAFPHGKNILSDCTNKIVTLNKSDSSIVGSCINTITSDGYIDNVKIYSLKLVFSKDNIERVDVKLKVSIGISINDTFKITLTRSAIV
jgi:hypothetical protein